MRLRRFAWLLWVVGTVLIMLSWADKVSPTIGWIGFCIAVLGVLFSLSWPANPKANIPRDGSA